MAQPASVDSSSSGVFLNFSVAPYFYNLSFPDYAPIDEVWRHCLAARRKSSEAASLQGIFTAFQQQTKAKTVGELRRLTESEWRSLELPAMAKLYLRHIVRQSQRPRGSAMVAGSAGQPSERLKELQNDFNGGEPFDMTQFEASLAVIEPMGISREVALECLLITENRSLEAALELIFQEPEKRKAKREEAVQKIKRANGGSKANSAAATASLLSELDSAKRQLASERQNRQRAEAEKKNFLDARDRLAYKEYLRGLICGESFNLPAYEQMKSERENRKISQSDHNQILGELGISIEKFESMKHFDSRHEKECVACLDALKDHACFPCMHLCLCEKCSEDFSHQKNGKCPLCSKNIQYMVKIFL